MPTLILGNIVAVYIRRKPVVVLLIEMMKGEIDGNHEVLNVFLNKQAVNNPYSLIHSRQDKINL
ncbi:MAG: hypothetical protein EOP48_26785 [Sphingobacteriales bacterium]|nr:MAG: hypothetical protein EOP48_26785 [Sphingobacteriales bacterium]